MHWYYAGFLKCDLRFKAITEQPTCLSRGCERQGYCQQEQRQEGPKAWRSSRLFHKDSSSPVPGCRWKGMRNFRQNQNLADCLCFQLPFCFIVSDVNQTNFPTNNFLWKESSGEMMSPTLGKTVPNFQASGFLGRNCDQNWQRSRHHWESPRQNTVSPLAGKGLGVPPILRSGSLALADHYKLSTYWWYLLCLGPTQIIKPKK